MVTFIGNNKRPVAPHCYMLTVETHGQFWHLTVKNNALMV